MNVRRKDNPHKGVTALVRRAKAGDNKAFEELVRRYHLQARSVSKYSLSLGAGLPAVESLHDEEAEAMGTVVTELLER